MKNILKSKTFWLNVIGVAADYGGYLPQKYAIPVMAGVNIVNRFFTSVPITLLPVSNTQPPPNPASSVFPSVK
jgi:hypothetical protein